MALDRVDVGGKLGEHRGRVARARADFQDAIGRRDFRDLRHPRDNVGLRDGLALIERQGGILVGELAHRRGQKIRPLDLAHRRQHAGIPDAATGNLAADHAGDIGNGHSMRTAGNPIRCGRPPARRLIWRRISKTPGNSSSHGLVSWK